MNASLVRARRMLGGLLAAILLAAPVFAQSAAADRGRPLADRLEVAFRACAQQLTQRDHLAPANAALLRGVGITLRDDPPAEVRGMAARLFGAAGRYAAVATSSGTMWIAGSATVPACKVTLADTPLAPAARRSWRETLRTTGGWRYDQARSGPVGPIVRDLLVFDRARPGPRLVVMLDGPDAVADQGRGIQLIMTVALEPETTVARPATPPAAAADEGFARALVDICPGVAARGAFAANPALVPTADRPPALADYPATPWYALASAPRSVFVSLDAAPGPPRCRAVLADGSGAAAHDAAAAALTRAGGKPVAAMAFEPRRGLMESVWVIPGATGGTLVLVQSEPAAAASGATRRATGTAIAVSAAEAQAMGRPR